MGGGGFFENCHDFNINNGNFTNVNGDYYSTDNSRRTIIQNSGNTTTTTYNNSFNNTPQTNYNHYDRPTYNHGPVSNIGHVGNLNTGTNYGQIGNNAGGWYPPPPSSNSPPFGAGYPPWAYGAQPWMYPPHPHPPSHPGSPPGQQSQKPTMGSNNPYFRPDVPFGPQADGIPPTPQSAPEPRYGQSGGYFDPSSPPPQPDRNPSPPGLRTNHRSEPHPQPPGPAPAPFPDIGASIAQQTQNHLAFLQNQRNAAVQEGNLSRQMEHLSLDNQPQRPSPSPTPSARSSNGGIRQGPVHPQGHPSGANPWTAPNPSLDTMNALRRADSSESDSSNSDGFFTNSKKPTPEDSRTKPSRFKLWKRGKGHQGGR